MKKRYESDGMRVWDHDPGTDDWMTTDQVAEALNRYHEANLPVTGEWLESVGFVPYGVGEWTAKNSWRHNGYRIAIALGVPSCIWSHCGSEMRPDLDRRGQLLDYIETVKAVQLSLTEGR